MKISILIGISIGLMSCLSNKTSLSSKMTKQDILEFLDVTAWTLRLICIEKNCEEVSDDLPLFGIEIGKPTANICTNEMGAFYILGQYASFIDPETYEKNIDVLSSPDYFKISKFN